MSESIVQAIPNLLAPEASNVVKGIVEASTKGIPVIVTGKVLEKFGELFEKLGIKAEPFQKGQLPERYVMIVLSGIVVKITIYDHGVVEEVSINIKKFESTLKNLVAKPRVPEVKPKLSQDLYVVVVPEDVKNIIEAIEGGEEDGQHSP